MNRKVKSFKQTLFLSEQCKKKQKISQRRLRSVARELIPFGALSRRGLTPVELAYNLRRPDGQLR